MDLSIEIEEFLKRKPLSSNTIKSQRSALLAFNKWLCIHQPNSLNTASKSYENYIRSYNILKPKTADQQIALIDRFITWTTSKGKISSFSLEGQVLGNPALKTIALPVPSDYEIQLICEIVLKNGVQKDFKNVFMMLLAITCHLSPEHIASLQRLSLVIKRDYKPTGILVLLDGTIYLPHITACMGKLYLQTSSYAFNGASPLFPETYKKNSPHMKVSDVIKGIDEALSLVGCSYEESVQGDSQYAIAQHFKLLDDEQKVFAASFVVQTYYSKIELPFGALKMAQTRTSS